MRTLLTLLFALGTLTALYSEGRAPTPAALRAFPIDASSDKIEQFIQDYLDDKIDRFDLFSYLFKYRQDQILLYVKALQENHLDQLHDLDTGGWTNPLELAITTGQFDLAKQISDIDSELVLLPGAGLSAQFSGPCPLTFAVKLDQVDLVKYLIDKSGADINKALVVSSKWLDFASETSDILPNLLYFAKSKEMEKVLLVAGIEDFCMLGSSYKTTINDNNVNLRSRPSLSSAVVTKLSKGDRVLVHSASAIRQSIGSSTDRWFRIDFGEYAGYVFGAFLASRPE